MTTADQRPNMHDVASLAGVSHMTVSRVLNGHPNIRPATRDKVLKAIEAVNYRPNGAARALASRRSHRIGVIIDAAVEYGPNSTLRAIEHAAQKRGYTVATIAVSDDHAIGVQDALDSLMSQGVEALCLIAPRHSSLDLLRDSTVGVPTVAVKPEDDETFMTVAVDQAAGARMAMEHLIELGHRCIVHVAGPLDWLDARARERAWRDIVREHGLVEFDMIVGDWSSDFGYEFARSQPRLPEFTAVFAGNDQMALGLLHGFRDAGIRVPEDVSVVGYDDLPDAKHFLPPLTTVRQDFDALGERSFEALLAVLEDGAEQSDTRITPELVVRASSAPPRTEG